MNQFLSSPSGPTIPSANTASVNTQSSAATVPLTINGISQHQLSVNSFAGTQAIQINGIKGKLNLTNTYQAQLLHEKVNNANYNTILRLFDQQASKPLPLNNTVSQHILQVSRQHVEYNLGVSQRYSHEANVTVNAVKGTRIILDTGTALTAIIREVSKPSITAGNPLRLLFDKSSPPAVAIAHNNGVIEPLSVASKQQNSIKQLQALQQPMRLNIAIDVTAVKQNTVNLDTVTGPITAKIISAKHGITPGSYSLSYAPEKAQQGFSLQGANGKTINLHINRQDQAALVASFLQNSGQIKLTGHALANLVDSYATTTKDIVNNISKQAWVNLSVKDKGQITAEMVTQKAVTDISIKPGQQSELQALKLPQTVLSSTVSPAASTTINAVSNVAVSSLQGLLNQLQGVEQSPKQLMASIQSSLASTALSAQPALAAKLVATVTEIKQNLANGGPADAQLIQQLLTAPSTNIVPTIQLNQPVSPVIAGLVQLVQFALSSKLQTLDSRKFNENSLQMATKLVANNTVTSQQNSLANTPQNQFQKQLMQAAMGLLKQHQYSKVDSGDKTIKGTEQLHYQVPYVDGNEYKQAEVLVQKDTQQQANADLNSSHTWQLSMKLAAGTWGDILAKAKLQEQQVSLTFLANESKTVNHIKQALPQLNQRLESLGMTVINNKCQQGVIPESLIKQPYRLFEAFA